MKRQVLKSVSAFCVSVMTLFAASSLVVSCYDDSALWEEMDGVKEQLTTLEQKVEEIKAQLETLAASVDGLYTLTFQASSTNELQYSFDGGKTWKGTGINLAKECDAPCVAPCECPKVSLVDNGDSVTITVGSQSYTIEKPKEIVFEIRAGKVYFESEGTVAVAIKSAGVEDLAVLSAPKGWWAEITSEGKLEVTAPNYEDTQAEMDYETWTEIPAKYAASGYVKVHACGVDGSCMVGKLPVEVVSQPLSVKAYGGNAYFNVATTYAWGPTYFYGVATKETLEAETSELLKAMSSGGWDHYDVYANTDAVELVVSIEELFGEEPQLGNEYVVWAVVEDYSKQSYSAEDLVLAYYTPLQVTIAEVEAEKTAYNVTATIDVVGAESYVAVALPALYCDDPEYNKEQMVMALSQGQYYGKLYTESYSGSVLDVAAGTTYSMTGLYSPNSEVYLFVLPLDGRPVEDYTAADVVSETFTTAELVSGGSIKVEAKQVTSYMGEVYDYDIWDYVEKLIELDPYTQLGVEATLSPADEWVAFYYTWMTDEDYALYGSDDALVVDYLLENSYGNTPADVEKWPAYIVEEASPNTTMHFVAFVVDKAGKYGEVAHVEATTAELVKADFTWVENVETNVVDGVLKNSETLRFTPAFEGGVEAAAFKYVLSQVSYYNPYEGMDDAQLAEELFFSTSSSVVTVTAEELVNGVLHVDGHSYGYPYFFAIVPIDADGNPGASAYILEYETVFALEAVATEGADFEASMPEIKINLPADEEFYPDGNWGDAAYYGYEYQSYYDKYNFYYELNYEVTPVEGTTVAAVLVDCDSYTLADDLSTRAGQVWSGSLGSWNTITTSEYIETSYRYFNNYNDEPAPAIVLCVSWTDAEGNYYYTQYELQKELQYYADKMNAELGFGSDEPAELPTPDGKQWAFTWMQMGGVPTILDFGVTLDGQCVVAYDPVVMGAPEGTPYQIYNMLAYEFVATDATSGKLILTTTNMFGEELSQEFEYSNLTETSCHFEFDENSFVGESVDGTLTEVEVDMAGGVM